jgi:hypothetical protein
MASTTVNSVNKATTNGGLSKTEKDFQQALSIIEKALPKMTILNALLELDIGGAGPIFVDARGEPRLLTACADEPACRVKTKPEYIKQFAEGKLEPRYGLFKDGFFDETTLPTGDISVAVKFADLLSPVNPTNTAPLPEGTVLPKPTEDIEQVKADMKEFGYGLVKNALSAEQIYTLKEAVRQQAEGEVKAGVAAKDGGPTAPNQRIWTLINKGQEFLDLLEHPLIDEIVPETLGEHALIHSYSANIARPGNSPMMLHTDQVAIQPPIRDIAFGLNIMWFLSDVTRDNVSTFVSCLHLSNLYYRAAHASFQVATLGLSHRIILSILTERLRRKDLRELPSCLRVVSGMRLDLAS